MDGWVCACGTQNAPEFLECQACGRPQALVAGAADLPGEAEKTCPRCQRSWPANAAFCRHCGHRFPDRADLAGMPFTPSSDRTIRAEAYRSLVQKPDRAGPAAQIGAAFLLAGLSLLIPGVGLFLLLGGSLVGAWLVVRHLGALLGPNPPDPEALAARVQEWRLMCRGECPHCGQGIRVIPYAELADFLCPACHGPLHYEEGYVSAR
jgi:hypothetical protein